MSFATLILGWAALSFFVIGAIVALEPLWTRGSVRPVNEARSGPEPAGARVPTARCARPGRP